ncbi:SMP-30/gluconolactonase/LRE family protein [Jannaschia sp. Os4]|uniref:SMP-30/gluconolactonase/LRE family protein n=1 Tax=Jannaschia sp. Os4 TaxID=2807617 RepID=UPI0031B5DD4A
MKLWDDRRCELGEGILRHPGLDRVFWLDILGRRLLARDADGTGPADWAMPEIVSALGWIDDATLFLAGETGFWSFALGTGEPTKLVDLEADDPGTRSNDGRADPMGGFWMGTMGLGAEGGRGAFYRYYRGEVRKLYAPASIPNGLCFSPDGAWAYMADSAAATVWRVRLDRAGWPSLKREPFLDLRAAGLAPDGAVTDAEGNLWIAQWGASRVAVHAPDGRFLRAASVPAPHVTCPCFAGEGRLLVTTATQGMDPVALQAMPGAGMVWKLDVTGRGRDEPRVVIA